MDDIINEILSGEYKRDILPEYALKFSGEPEACYFSRLRNNLRSDMAYAVMNNSQDTSELFLLNEIKGEH